MSDSTENTTISINAIVVALQRLIIDQTAPLEPPGELLLVNGFAELYHTMLEVRNALKATVSGDLNFPVEKKGYLPSAIKIFQASLRHLTRQTQAIADGDFSQRVEFLGEFSEALNRMVIQLDSTLKEFTRAEAEIRETKEHFEMIFNSSPDAAIISRLHDGRIIDVNAGFTDLTGFTREETVDNAAGRLDIWVNPGDHERSVNEIGEFGTYNNFESQFRRKDGTLFTGVISANITTLHDTPHIISIIRDISERKQAEEALRESEEVFRRLYEDMNDPILLLKDGRFIDCNSATLRMLGYDSKPEFLRKSPAEISLDYQPDGSASNVLAAEMIDKALRDGYHRFEWVHTRIDGSPVPVEVTLTPITIGGEVILHTLWRDITERKLLEEVLQRQAHTDPLTGANNRGYLLELLDKEMERARRFGRPISLLVLDLDHFKAVNDTRGHAAGDEALRTMNRVFHSSGLRQSDFWGRIGGEEFVVVFPETGCHDAAGAAERIRAKLAETPVQHGDECFHITASIGVSEYKDGDVQETLLHRADQAMYEAKQSGRNRICLAQ